MIFHRLESVEVLLYLVGCEFQGRSLFLVGLTCNILSSRHINFSVTFALSSAYESQNTAARPISSNADSFLMWLPMKQEVYLYLHLIFP